MKKILLLISPLAILINVVIAQTTTIQQGILLKTGTGIRLANIKIQDKESGLTRLSNLYGVFRIPAKAGDTLEISADNYKTQLIKLTDLVDKVLYLDPITQLPEVLIKGSSLAEDLQAVQKGYRDKGVFYTGRPHYYYLFLKPMTFIYENFKSEVIQARKFNKYAKREIKNSFISNGFNDDIIKKYTPITDSELFDFEWRYAPTYEQAKNWSNYDFIEYIKKSYLKFKNLQQKK